MKLTMPGILFGQLGKTQPVATTDLTGKTVVVVGANTGLGFEACKHFARMKPARLIMACRNRQRGEEAIQAVEDATGYKGAQLAVLGIGHFGSIKDFAASWEGRLDILIMNAGMATADYTEVEGWESSIKTNHLGTAFVTLSLLPHLKATAKTYSVVPRVVVVSSDVHYLASIPEQIVNDDSEPILEKLSSKEYCTKEVMGERYPLTKLLNVFFVRALSEQLKDALYPVIITALNPGYCYSGLRRNASLLQLTVFWATDIFFGLTTEQGSRGLVWAAIGSTEDENRLRGEYISFSTAQEVSDFVLSEIGKRCQERVWNETIDILSKQEAKISNISKGQF